MTNLMLNCFIFHLILSFDYQTVIEFYELKILMMILNFYQKINYFKCLIMYLIVPQVFSEILHLKQDYTINNIVQITIMETIIAIVIIIVIMAVQNNVMQQHFQHMVLILKKKKKKKKK